MHKSIFKKPPPTADGAADGAAGKTPPAATTTVLPYTGEDEGEDEEDEDEEGDIAPLRSARTTGPSGSAWAGPTTANPASAARTAMDDHDEDEAGDDPDAIARRALDAEVPPIRIDDNDGRPLGPTGPPTMATILGVPALAEPADWNPPHNLYVELEGGYMPPRVTDTCTPDVRGREATGLGRAQLPLDPLPWTQFYERMRDVAIPDSGNVRGCASTRGHSPHSAGVRTRHPSHPAISLSDALLLPSQRRGSTLDRARCSACTRLARRGLERACLYSTMAAGCHRSRGRQLPYVSLHASVCLVVFLVQP